MESGNCPEYFGIEDGAYMNVIHDFMKISLYSGMREDLVQAGGGNTSGKVSNEEMYIKASGCQLSEVSETDGWCKVNPKIIVDYFSKDNPEITQDAEKELISKCLISGNRPSIEVFLHSITQKYTLHTHPTVVNILASTENGWEVLKKLFPDALFVKYATPGIKLAAEYFKAFKAFGKMPEIIFLQNHGLVVSGDSAEFVKEKTESVLYAIEKNLGLDMERYHIATKIYDVSSKVPELKNKIVFLSQHQDVLKGMKTFGSNLWEYQFCPDCLVYCGKKVLVLKDDFTESDFSSHIASYGNPVIISYKNNAYILAVNVKKAKDIESVLAFSAQIAISNKNSSINKLSDCEQNFLLNWDAEKYRQSVK